jgi:quinol monooxygenase YgiN
MGAEHIILNVQMEAVPGREEELARELRRLVVPTRKEPGCLAYWLHHDPEHLGKFMFYERFIDQAALDAHLTTPHFQQFQDYRQKHGDPVATTQVTRWHEMK